MKNTNKITSNKNINFKLQTNYNMKKMKIILNVFVLLLMVNINAQVTSKSESNSIKINSIFQNESGEIKVLEVASQFQSLSPEVIADLDKIPQLKNNFVHLATDINFYYIMRDLSDFNESQRNAFYTEIHNKGFYFQVSHGLPDGLVWVYTSKEKYTPNEFLRTISNLLTVSTKN
jgi:hypothetical protein